jgi:hypothetical protein
LDSILSVDLVVFENTIGKDAVNEIPEIAMLYNMIDVIQFVNKAHNKRDITIRLIKACRNVAVFMLDHARPTHSGWDLEPPANIIRDIICILEIEYDGIGDDEINQDNLFIDIERICCNNLNFYTCVMNELNRYNTDEV